MRIVHDLCELCSLQLEKQIHNDLKEKHPKWYGKTGNLLGRHFDVWSKKCDEEKFRLNKGPTTVFETICTDCGEPFRICTLHLRSILEEMESYNDGEFV